MAGSQQVGARRSEVFRNDGYDIELVLTKAGMQYIEPLTRQQARTLYSELSVVLVRVSEDAQRSFEALEREGERPDALLHPSAVVREATESL